MKKILVFPGNQPCLDIGTTPIGITFGLNRDRTPDASWGELRKTRLYIAEEVELTPELKLILLEDLAYVYGNNTKEFNAKLKEFEFI